MMRKRSNYRPRQVNPMAALKALGYAAAAQSDAQLGNRQLRDLALGYSMALSAMMRGDGNAEDLATLSVASNVALLLCEYGLGDIATAHAAQDACMTIGARAIRTGRHGLNGQELRAMQELIELHDAQLASPDCTEGVLVAILKEVKTRAESGQVLDMASYSQPALAQGMT